MRPQCRRGVGNLPGFPETHQAVTELWEQGTRSRGGSRTGWCWGSHGTGHLLPLAMLPGPGTGWRERHFWLERQKCGEQTTTVAGEGSALPPQRGSWQGLCGQGEPQAIPHPGHPSSRPPLLCLSPRIRAAAAQHGALRALTAPACLSGGKLSCPLTCFNLQCHSCSALALPVRWDGFCSAGRFWGGWLCLSSPAGVRDPLPGEPWGLLAHWGRAISQDSQGRGRNKSKPWV